MLKKRVYFCLSSLLSMQFMIGGESTQSLYLPLKQEIDKVFSQLDKGAKVSAQVVSVKDGQVIYEKNPTERLVPAASVQLLIAGAILDQLGPCYSFETKLVTDGTIDKQKLTGNLYLIGAGDPSLKGHSLEDLIFQLKLVGIKEIHGDLVFDGTEFDELTLAPGWMWDEKIEYRKAPVDALTINHSCVKIWVKPSADLKQAPFVTISPEIPGIVIENQAKMHRMDPSKDTIAVSTIEKGEQDAILVSGELSNLSDMLKFKIPVKDPLLYVATEFRERLKRNGITHEGKIRFDAASEGFQTLAVHFSEPLLKLIMYMIKNSDALYANCFFKKLGSIVYGKPGTWPNGSQSLKSFLLGIDEKIFADVALIDGSGESSCNLLSSNQMVKFLNWASKDFLYSPELTAALPLSGIDAAFRKRLGDKFLKAKIRAKAGSLKGVSTLSGYIIASDGEPLAFSIIINDSKTPSREIKNQVEDRVCQILAHFSKGDHYAATSSSGS